MITRDLHDRLLQLAQVMPVVMVTGPRQSGKTTLCKSCFPSLPYVNLELPDNRLLATDDPRFFLSRFPDGAVLDEIQNCPALLSYVQVLVDEDPRCGRWVLSGSQNLLLLESVTQTLAGRTAVMNLLPLTFNEIQRFPDPPSRLDEVLLTGGFPRIFDRNVPPHDFLESYLATYVERDVRTISNVGDLLSFRKFMALCAGRTGQLLNLSSLGSDAGISQPTAKTWLSILEAGFLVFRLPAWHGNIRKRLTRSPKLHFWDSGLVCRLLGIQTEEQLQTHPLRGAIFESWVVTEIAKYRLHRGHSRGLHHFRDQHGNEVDLVIDGPEGLELVEIKVGQTINRGLDRGLVRVGKILEKASIKSRTVVYGGDTVGTIQGASLRPWAEAYSLAAR